MRVLYFGTYDRDYPRNAQVISCLRGAGVEVVERHASVWEGRRQSWQAGLGTAARLAAAELRLLRRPAAEFDVLLVGYPGHLDLAAARRYRPVRAPSRGPHGRRHASQRDLPRRARRPAAEADRPLPRRG